MKHKYKIRLDTYRDIEDFVSAVSEIEDRVLVTDGELVGNGKSLLNMVATIEWNELWCICDKDIYFVICKWIVE